MGISFYIIDDDDAVRHMLGSIIQKHIEDSIIHQNDSPWQGILEIEKLKPEIVLLDLLMPEMDGLEVAMELQKKGFNGRIIMISEVNSKPMIEKAYASGVEYFISKPINVTEVLTIIHRTMENVQLKAYLRTIHQPRVTGSVDSSNTDAKTCDHLNVKLLNDIYKDLGLIGESGLWELTTAVEIYYEMKVLGKVPSEAIQLQDIYERIQTKRIERHKEIGIKGIEQRLRRLTGGAMENIAHMGVEDFSHYRFEKYAGQLFHFKSIRQEMDFIRKKSLTRGKIDVRRFIEGIVNILDETI